MSYTKYMIRQAKNRRWELHHKPGFHYDWILIAGNLTSEDDALRLMSNLVEEEKYVPPSPRFFDDDGNEVRTV